MTGVRNGFARSFLLGTCALVALSCAETTAKEAKEADEPKSEWPNSSEPGPSEESKAPSSSQAASGCPGDKPDQPKECKSNEDCCKGYVCSLDPDLSRVVRYCLEG